MDRFSKEKRSEVMSRVRGCDTLPELKVRKALFLHGFRFRLHAKQLPGRPDIVLPGYRTVVFVHGCFWHGHTCSKGVKRPSEHSSFWTAKLDANHRRDRRVEGELESLGWKVVKIWECETKDPRILQEIIGKRLPKKI